MRRVLLDTHALIWAVSEDRRLSKVAANAIKGAENVYVSAASVWEITTKFRLGKLPSVVNIINDLENTFKGIGLISLTISMKHAHRAGLLLGPHKDPFDRMLIAQALIENMTLISNEKIFDQYGVERVW